MRSNKHSLLQIASGSAIKEGSMFYKVNDNAFKERWFKLCANLLFYYQKNVPGRDQEPVGVLLMENFVTIRDNENLPNTFSILFLAEPDVKYFFFNMNSKNSNEWFEQLSRVSYRQQRLYLSSLRTQIKDATGNDPLESTAWSDKL